MAIFRRNKTNGNDYLATPSTTSRPMAILSALFTGLLVAAAVVAIYFGGKWLYDRFNSSKDDTPSANVENNDQSTNNAQNEGNSGNSGSSDGSGSSNQNNTSSGTGSGSSSSSNNNGSSSGSGTSNNSSSQSDNSGGSESTPLTSTGATPEAETIPNTGPDPNYNY